AERFEAALGDVFELQDRVATSVAGAIEPKLRQSEIQRAVRKPTDSLDAYDLYLRALSHFYPHTEEGFEQALALVSRGLNIDPSYAPAAALVGSIRMLQRSQGWGAVSDDDLADAVRLARRALELARDDADTLSRAAFALFYLAGDIAIAATAFDRAIR